MYNMCVRIDTHSTHYTEYTEDTEIVDHTTHSLIYNPRPVSPFAVVDKYLHFSHLSTLVVGVPSVMNIIFSHATPSGGQGLHALVVASQAVNAALDEDEPELGVLVLDMNKKSKTLQSRRCEENMLRKTLIL